jgi:SAM-dependent methyltransferase
MAAADGRFDYRRCETCGTVFMHPQVDEPTLAAAYSPEYGPYRRSPTLVERVGERIAQREASRLASYADPSSTLLDVGCGRGTFLRRLKRAGWTGPLRGVEPDPAVAALTHEEVGVPVAVGTLDEVELESGGTGTVVLRHVLEHVRDPRATLQLVSELLVPGGTLYVATPDARSLAASVFRRFWHGYDPPRHLFAFTSGGLRRLLARCDFELVAESWDFSPQMWSGSLRHALGRGQPERMARARWLAHDLNPLVAVPSVAGASIEVALRRSTMYAATARRTS